MSTSKTTPPNKMLSLLLLTILVVARPAESSRLLRRAAPGHHASTSSERPTARPIPQPSASPAVAKSIPTAGHIATRDSTPTTVALDSTANLLHQFNMTISLPDPRDALAQASFEDEELEEDIHLQLDIYDNSMSFDFEDVQLETAATAESAVTSATVPTTAATETLSTTMSPDAFVEQESSSQETAALSEETGDAIEGKTIYQHDAMITEPTGIETIEAATIVTGETGENADEVNGGTTSPPTIPSQTADDITTPSPQDGAPSDETGSSVSRANATPRDPDTADDGSKMPIVVAGAFAALAVIAVLSRLARVRKRPSDPSDVLDARYDDDDDCYDDDCEAGYGGGTVETSLGGERSVGDDHVRRLTQELRAVSYIDSVVER